jgi:hypothetical protein
VADDVRVLHDGRVTARGPAQGLDLHHELMSPPTDGHVHDADDPRGHHGAPRGRAYGGAAPDGPHATEAPEEQP